MKPLKLAFAVICLSATSLTHADNVTPSATSRPNNEAQQLEDNCGLATMWFTYNRFFDSACPWSRDRSAMADTLRGTFKSRCSNTAISYWSMRNRLNLTNRLEDEASEAHLSTQDYCMQITPSFIHLGKTTEHNLKFGTSQKSDKLEAENVLKVPAKVRSHPPIANVPAPNAYN